ncbi:hypothetical protein AN189_07360 [Loktanella sp. 3ANDIMAR09]|uniref:hypothetical protein n=1 Tax=Loktanella sp. 3ANDIMAR09 TaxID=1225657 RepID=UPI0006FAC552|nr:hypothetical protein [Loktanella sp. 3ANDIMAR09]KQI68711.1 hypothetical protein AN189_07360 [Loktanella sp. 3ANDIMAR09]
MASPTPSRNDDERVLEILKLRCAGEIAKDIAARLGVGLAYVNTKSNAVRNDDIAASTRRLPGFSGEKEIDVRAGYW